jgi:ABC-type bacteriocin/lantibiotic exporter with double-glycine peptidase domain
MMNRDWAKLHVFQEKSGWCGPAVIQMALAYSGIRKSQKVIARDVYLNWWGTSNEIMITYLSKYFRDLGDKKNSKIKDIQLHFKRGHLIIINWWDNDGHYSIISEINSKNKTLTLIDPSCDRCGIWNMNIKKFKKRWFDYVDTRNKIKVNNWFLWINPRSKIIKQ